MKASSSILKPDNRVTHASFTLTFGSATCTFDFDDDSSDSVAYLTTVFADVSVSLDILLSTLNALVYKVSTNHSS